MNPGLHAAHILVTRPSHQAGKLAGLIEAAGGIALRVPVIEIIESCPGPQAWQTAVESDWLIFTSRNAVDFAIRRLNGKMAGFNPPRIAAIGESTAEALRQSGWRVDCVPETEFSSGGLLAVPAMQDVAGKTCVIVRGAGGLEKLSEILSGRGAVVAYLEVYRRCRPETDAAELKHSLANRQIDAVTVTSNEALENLLILAGQEWGDLLKSLPLVVVSGRIGQAAEKMGFKWIAVSRQPTDSAIIETLNGLFDGENSGRSIRTTRDSSFQH